MTGNVVARRYAKALFAVGVKQGDAELEAYGKELSELAGALEGAPEAMRFFKNPVFGPDEKKAVLGKLLEKCEAKPVLKNFCDLLADKDRLPILPDVSAVFGKLLDETRGLIRGNLVTAKELSDARKGQIKEKLEKQAGRKLELSFSVDRGILGGVVLQIGDKVLDASLRAQLEILKETIKRGE